MPIVIDEVLITVEVDNAGTGGQAGAGAAPAAGSTPAATDKQALVAECVERVLDILAAQKEP